MTAAQAQKVTTFLMFEGNAEEAMTFYTSLFKDSEVLALTRYGPGEAGAEGTLQAGAFSLAGQRFMCIDSAVSHDFGFTPAISLWVECDTEDEIDRLYTALGEGGQVHMPLGTYGFSAKFGWIDDRFGVSWQLNLLASV
jgi:predicted 3-demethylubiquinone-9 3-methyltransferase (glyoxalase superfamily)